MADESDIETPAQRARARRQRATAGSKTAANTEEKPRPKSTLNPEGRRTPKWAKLEQQLTDMYTSIAIPFSVAGDEFSASLIVKRANVLASSWVDLAQENESVARVLNNLIAGSAWGGVIVVHAMTFIPIAAHHNLIPGEAGQRIKAASEFALMAEEMQTQAAAAANGNGA